MEGYSLLRSLREVLNETSTSSFLNDRTSYDLFYTAAQDFNFRTHYLTGTQTINISAGTNEYNLNPDFVCLALMDSFNRNYIKWTYSGNDTFIYSRDYGSLILENNLPSASIPGNFSITDASQLSNITGTATSSGSAVNGECNLIDNTSPFTNVSAGDFVHNTTQGTDGIVVSKTSSSQVVCSLFTDGTSGYGFTSADAYIIVPQPRYKLVFDITPSDSATVTVVYIKRPDPVYSPYRAYKLPFNYMMALVKYAAFMYKYKDREPNYGDAFFKYYDGFVRKISSEMRRGIPEKSGMRVNFSKVNARSRNIGNWNR